MGIEVKRYEFNRLEQLESSLERGHCRKRKRTTISCHTVDDGKSAETETSIGGLVLWQQY